MGYSGTCVLRFLPHAPSGPSHEKKQDTEGQPSTSNSVAKFHLLVSLDKGLIAHGYYTRRRYTGLSDSINLTFRLLLCWSYDYPRKSLLSLRGEKPTLQKKLPFNQSGRLICLAGLGRLGRMGSGRPRRRDVVLGAASNGQGVFSSSKSGHYPPGGPGTIAQGRRWSPGRQPCPGWAKARPAARRTERFGSR